MSQVGQTQMVSCLIRAPATCAAVMAWAMICTATPTTDISFGPVNQVNAVKETKEDSLGGTSRICGEKVFAKNDIVGCLLDLNVPCIKFTLNGQPVDAYFKDFNIDGFFCPAISMSAKVR